MPFHARGQLPTCTGQQEEADPPQLATNYHSHIPYFTPLFKWGNAMVPAYQEKSTNLSQAIGFPKILVSWISDKLQ